MQIRHLDSQVSDWEEPFQQKEGEWHKRRNSISLLSLLTVLFYTGISDVAQGGPTPTPAQIPSPISAFVTWNTDKINDIDASITSSGAVVNKATFTNNSPSGILTNAGTLGNQYIINNDGILTNNKSVNNGYGGATGTFVNTGTLNNGVAADLALDAPLAYFRNGSDKTSGTVGVLTNTLEGEIYNYGNIQNGYSGGANTITNSGSITNYLKISNGYLASGVGTLTNSGTILNSGSKAILYNGFQGNGTLTNTGTITNDMEGRIYNGFGGGTGTLNNYGTINNVSGNFANGYNPSGDVNTGSGTINNYFGASFSYSGLFYNGVKNNGTVNNWGAFTNTSTGTIFNGNGTGGTHTFTIYKVDDEIGVIHNYGNFYNAYGGDTGTVNNSGIVNNYEGAKFVNGFQTTGTPVGSGTINNYAGAQINNSGIFYNGVNSTGTITNNGGIANNLNAYFYNGYKAGGTGILTNNGTLVNSGDFSNGYDTGTGTLTNSITGTFDNHGTLTNGIGSTVTNAGIFNNDGTFTNDGTFDNNSGASFNNTGTFVNTGTYADLSASGFINEGIIEGTGTINGNVTNNKTLAPGNSIGTVTIVGNYVHNASATYEVEIDASGNSDLTLVKDTTPASGGGHATLNGGTVEVQPLSPISEMRRYTILTADNGVTGTFDSPTTGTLSTMFLRSSLLYDSNNVYLDVTSNFYDYAKTENQHSVTSVLDHIPGTATGDMKDVMTSIINQPSVDAALNAIDQISGHIHTALPGATLYSIDQNFKAIENDREWFGENGQHNIRHGFWASGLKGVGNRDGADIASRYEYNLSGGLAGSGHLLSDTLVFGASLGYSTMDVTMNDLSEKGNVKSWQGSLYALSESSPLHVGFIASYGHHRFETERNLSFGDISRQASSRHTGYSLSALLEAGYRVDFGNKAYITPTASFQAIRLNRDAFTEQSASSLNLLVAGEHTTSFPGRLGFVIGKSTMDSKGGRFNSEVSAFLRHEFASSNQYSHTAAFAGAPDQTFVIKGDSEMRNSCELGIKFLYETSSHFSIFTACNANQTKNLTEQTALAGISFKW